MNVTDRILDQAHARATHPAIDSAQGIISYAELAALIEATHARLLASGIVPGDTVGVRLNNCAQHLVLLCALARLGAIVLPVDTRLLQGEVREMAQALQLKYFVHAGEAGAGADMTLLQVDALVPSSTAVPAAAQPAPHPEFDASLPCAIIQSSGTTGTPKRRLQSHGQLATWMQYFPRYFSADENVRYLVNGQLSFNVLRFHCFSILGLGGTVVLDDRANPENQLATIQQHAITFLLVPSAFQAQQLLDQVGDAVPCIPGTTIMVGSSYFSPALKRRMRQQLTTKLFEVYAANESGLIACSEFGDADRFPAAVGKVIEDIEVEIVDRDGQVLPADEIGLVRIRGPYFPAAYIDDPGATAQAFRDGWFYPQDAASINAQGYLFLKGRADDAISSQGVMFYPAEVENVLIQHPNIVEVAVIGWPHEQTGEVAAAFIVVRESLDGQLVLDFARQHLASYKVPRFLVHCKRLPKNPQGKILKYQLRDILEARLRKTAVAKN